MSMKFRKIVRVVHRDLGYLSAVLLIIYSVSGIAVNHLADWNPNYIIEKTEINFTPNADTNLTQDQMQAYIVDKLSITDSVENRFRESVSKIDLFFEGKTISADLRSGIAQVEIVNDRTVIKETNFLHLNKPKKLWTYVADGFAVALCFLAITGMFILKGKNGLAGRGKYFLIIGAVIPILFLIFYL
ncbi:MAG: hypothetical protein D8M61_14015 [Ignavibacteriae bacterium]|nr:hypothetical protein [Ignavibacteriota bacterium]